MKQDFTRIRIRPDQVGLAYRRGHLIGELAPGSYWLPAHLLKGGNTRLDITLKPLTTPPPRGRGQGEGEQQVAKQTVNP